MPDVTSLPAWLFCNNNKTTDADPLQQLNSATSKMGKPTQKSKKSFQAASPARKAASAAQPPRQLLDMVERFLADNSFDKACNAFKKQRECAGLGSQLGCGNGSQSLLGLYRFWEVSQAKAGTKAEAQATDSTSDESSSENSSSSSSRSSSVEAEVATKRPAALKRKAPGSTRSSSSSSDSSSSDHGSDSDSKPRPKKQKTASAPESGSDSDSPSSSSDSGGMDVDQDSSDSDAESDSDSDDSEEAATAAKVPLPESDSSSDSSDTTSSDDSSDSDSQDEKAKPKPKHAKSRVAAGATTAAKESSDSSVTLDAKSPEPKISTANPPLPPDPVTAVPNNHKKKQPEHFSRIPKDIKVNPKFASNSYVSMDYSKQAYDDLVVTKGKGFTKEKNKKKRGSFRGGMIDIYEKKGVYFDD